MEKARTEPLVTRYPFARVVRFFGSSYVYFGEYSPADRYRSTTARSTSNRDRDQFSPVMEQVGVKKYYKRNFYYSQHRLKLRRKLWMKPEFRNRD